MAKTHGSGVWDQDPLVSWVVRLDFFPVFLHPKAPVRLRLTILSLGVDDFILSIQPRRRLLGEWSGRVGVYDEADPECEADGQGRA